METKNNFVEKSQVIEKKIMQVASHIVAFDKPNCVFESCEFSTGAKLGDTWKISIHMNNNNASELRDFISVYVQNMSDHVFNAKVKFFIVNNKRQKLFINFFQYLFSAKAIWGFNGLVPKKWLLENRLEFLPEDTFTVYTVVTVFDDYEDRNALIVISENSHESPKEKTQENHKENLNKNSKRNLIQNSSENQKKNFNQNSVEIKSPKFYNSSKTSLSDDSERLYRSKKDTDVTIVVKGRRFPAHKIFLKMRSQFLAEMLSQGATEKETKKDFVLADIKPGIFEKVLRFIYTDRADYLGNDAAEVLEAADKFQLETLKIICEESLSKSLNRENFIEIISLADRHFAKNLKNYAMEFFGTIAEDIVKSYDFNKLENTNPYLALELFKKFHILKINSLKINSEEDRSDEKEQKDENENERKKRTVAVR
ncbi:speckle-type POZ protein B-like [Cotesia typhae]|uniref:speckle-type POZ protein B-like n=1 Tax=Cotesia typhae TaxID=2053667 RepID=UPI003D69745A